MSELDKMLAVKEKSQIIGEFLEWLRNDKKYVVAYYPCHEREDGYDELMPVPVNTEELLAEFFKIDLNKAENEKRELLDQLRRRNALKVVPKPEDPCPDT